MSNTSFDKIIDTVFDGFKKITPALFAISVFSGLILFLPDSVLLKLGLYNLDETIHSIIGIVFLLSNSLIIAIVGSMIVKSTIKSVNHIRFRKKCKSKYLQLSLRHKEIIIDLFNSPSKSIELDATSGDTIYLIQNCFIHRPNQIVDPLNLYENIYTFVPQPWLIDLYQKEPALFVVEGQYDTGE